MKSPLAARFAAHRSARALVAAAAALALPATSPAADGTWTGAAGDGQWNTATNWSPAAVPTGGTATFNNATSTSINLASDLSQFALKFDTSSVGSFTFNTTTGKKFIGANSGQSVTITNLVTGSQVETFNTDFQTTPTGRTTNFDWGFTNSSATASMVFNAGVFGSVSVANLFGRLNVTAFGTGGTAGSVALNGVVSNGSTGSLLLVKKGAGLLTLANANTFSGGVEASAGVISLGTATSLGSGALRVNGNVTLQGSAALTGGSAVANSVNYVGTVGTATTTTLALTGTAGNNFATWDSGAAPAVGDLITSGASFGGLPAYTRVTAVTGTAGSGTITLSNNIATSFTGGTATTTQPFNTSGGYTTVIAGSNAIEFSGTQNLTSTFSNLAAATQTFNVTNTADTTFSGVLQQQGGAATVAKTGAGRLILSGTNTYTGGTNINGGTLQIASAQALGGTGTLASVGTIAFGGGTLQFTAANTTDYSSRFSGGANQAFSVDTNGQNVTLATQLAASSGGSLTKLGAGTLTLTGTTPVFTGTTTIGAGTLQLGNNGTTGKLPSGSAIVNNGTLFFNRSNNVSQGTDFSNTLSGSGSLVFSAINNSYGKSNLTSATNSYTGTTTISNGYLNVGANSITSGAAGPLGNATSAIVLGDANTQASLYGGAGPNVVLFVGGTAATGQSYTFGRNIDSSGSANVTGRNDIAFGGGAGATGTLTISGNWALTTGASRSSGLWAEQAGETLDYTGVISGGNSATRFRINDYGQGIGSVRLSNSSNSYPSATTVTTGTLIIGGDAGVSSGVLGVNATLFMAESGNVSNDSAALTDGAYTVGKTISLENNNTTTSTWTLGGKAAAASSFTGAINTASSSNNRTLNLSQVASGTVTFSGIIGANPGTGTTSVATTGAGTVVLSGTNAYDGTTAIGAGTLSAQNGAAIPDASAVSLADVAGATLNLVNSETIGSLAGGGTTGGNVTLNALQLITGQNNGSTTFGGVISSSSAVASVVKKGTGTMTLTGVNTLTGDTYVVGGTLAFAAGGSANGSTIRLGETSGSDAATLAITDAAGGATSVNSTLVVRPGSSGTKTITASNASGTSTFGGSVFLDAGVTVSSQNAGGTLAFTGSAFDLKTNQLLVTGSGNATIANAITNTGGNGTSGIIVKQGSGTLALAGANTYSGLTSIEAGAVRVDVTPASTSGTVFLGNGGTTGTAASLLLGGAGGTGGGVTYASLVQVNAGASNNRILGGVNVTGTTNTFSGTTYTNGGDLRVTSTNAGANLAFTNASAIDLKGQNVIFEGAGNTAVSGSVYSTGGGGSVAKNGTGTLTFSANNSYAGGTAVNAGTLLANNATSSTGSGSVTVNNAGTLGGTGRINGATTIADGGTITGGTVGAVGTLTLQNNVVFGGSSGSLSTYVVDLSGANNDRLAITGTLNLASAFDAISFQGTVDNTTTYILATFNGGLTGASDVFNTVTGVPAGYSLVYGTNDIELVPVPEPGTVAAGLLAFGTLGLSQRRRVRRWLGAARLMNKAA